MIIVADTSPLNYLVQIGADHVLLPLYGRIIVPPQVVGELLEAGAPEAVQEWAACPPAWLEVKAPAHVDTSLPIDPGEAAAIALARELKADRLLIDEQDGREVARRLGLNVAGTLAVLRDAALAGLLDLRANLASLQRTTFRASTSLYEQVLSDYERDRPKA
jgi:predicted nucleic acid-binding protein